MQDRTDPWHWQAEVHGALARSVALAGDGGTADSSSPLLDALGKHLSRDLFAPEDLPSLPIAAMDGFAVRSDDMALGTTLRVVGDVPATTAAATGPRVEAGTAVRVMTGAPLPAGAGRVVPWELTDADPAQGLPGAVRILDQEDGVPGRHVRSAGEEVAQGALLARAGQRVGPGLVGLAAALGIQELAVRGGGISSRFSGPLVSIVVTGDEVTAGNGLARGARTGAVRDSNGPMIAAAARAHGARSRWLRSPDDPTGLDEALRQAEDGAALVITTGGVGRGSRDVVRALLGEDGRRSSRFAHLALRPGGPQGWGRLPGGTPVVHLPGTPVGALVGFFLFAAPLLGGPLGTETLDRVELPGRARTDPRADGWRVLPGRRDGGGGVAVVPGSRLAPYARADSLLLLRPGAQSYAFRRGILDGLP